MMTRAEKEKVISDLRSNIESARGIFLTNLIGVTSNDAVKVRKEIRDATGGVVITRNTLFRKAAEGTVAEKLLADLKGPHAVAFAFEDSAAVAKCLKNASEDFEGIVELKGGILNGEELSKAQLVQLANLPSRDQMLGTLLATMNAPISALARVLNSVREQMEAGAPAVVAAAEAPAEEKPEDKPEE